MIHEYSIETLFVIYSKRCVSELTSPVPAEKFKRIFTEQFKINYEGPKLDTWIWSDQTNIGLKIAGCSGNGTEIKRSATTQELHLVKVEAARTSLTSIIEEPKRKFNVHVITFVSQQALQLENSESALVFIKKSSVPLISVCIPKTVVFAFVGFVMVDPELA